jgi:trimethylamine--corrinoid protein Co-methyltransferase
LQHEIISFVESVMRKIEFSENTLGLEEIEAVAGTGKTFLDRDHTLEHFRQELWVPTLLDRQYYQGWLEGGALSTEERCHQRKQQLLRTHKPDPLAEDLENSLDKIVGEARRELIRA